MKIPNTGRKKALIITDVQKTFVLDRNDYIVPKIVRILEKVDYDMIVCSISINEENSLWFKQIGWLDALGDDELDPRIEEALENKEYLKYKKLSRSAFKGELDINDIFRQNSIEEVHIVGYESNDCVLATAHESFDLGYYTFVIEEATETGSTPSNHPKAIGLLNYANITNNSSFVGKEKTEFIEI